MAGMAPTLQSKLLVEPLASLPVAPVEEYRRGERIYSPDEPAARIYFILEGRVKISRPADGYFVMMDINQADEFFGESALAGVPLRMELASALGDATVMSWSREEVHELASRRPDFAMTLLRLLARRTMDFGTRIESFSVDKIARRLTRALIHLAGRFGRPTKDGSVEMTAFSHKLLSEYVGASREIVTQSMIKFRQEGLVEYSRDGIVLLPAALKQWQKSPQKETRDAEEGPEAHHIPGRRSDSSQLQVR
jgi:CRP/FNR family transcriptional regulator, cyclic AMP receptor protein